MLGRKRKLRVHFWTVLANKPVTITWRIQFLEKILIIITSITNKVYQLTKLLTLQVKQAHHES